MKLFFGLIVTSALAAAIAAQDISVVRAGTQPLQAGSPENFTGTVRVERLFESAGMSGSTAALVTFEVGARSAWHTHPMGQTLFVTAGVGRLQQWGGPVQEIRKGDTVRIPPNVKHWHGASPKSAMSHLAMSEKLQGKSVEWLELVSDTQYNAPVETKAAAAASGPSRAQLLLGDIAPKLAELTDRVLFGDVWERGELSKRDRSLVTVAALVALHRPDQLRSHLALARENGLTQEELIEAITHLAFYTGWPSAVSGATAAREVFAK